MKIKNILVASLLSTVSLLAGNYNVDVAHSNIGFRVKHMMVSNVRGDFREFSGTFEYDEKTNMLKKLDGVIQAKSVSTENEKRDNHLRSADFFDVEKQPIITFKLTKAGNDEIYGDFTLKGITKKIKLDYEAGGSVKSPWGDTVAAFSLRGKIKRSDFGLKWNKALEAGGILVGDTIKLEIEIEGIKVK